MPFLKTKIWPVLAGFIVASMVMMVFEFTNSLFFPLPQDLDWANPEAVHALTASLPWTAYVLVLLGWMAGSFAGGSVATRLSGDTQYRTALALGVLLTLAGIWNVMLIGHPLLFTIISIPQFLIFTHLGHWYFRRPR
jgi:hypothetical protein